MPPKEPESEDAKQLFALASKAKQAGELEAALGYYTQALETAHSVELRSALLFHRSTARSALKIWGDAMLDANECLALRPSWSRSYECLAAVLDGLDRAEEATLARSLAASLAALKQDPSNETLRQQVRANRQELAQASQHANTDRGTGESNKPASQDSTGQPIPTQPPPANPDEPPPPQQYNNVIRYEPPPQPEEEPASPKVPAASDTVHGYAQNGNIAPTSGDRQEEARDEGGETRGEVSVNQSTISLDDVDRSEFHEGRRVQVHGLLAAWKYNGMQGKIIGREGERLVVALDDGGELHVKPKNLSLATRASQPFQASQPNTGSRPASLTPGSRVASLTPSMTSGTAAAKMSALQSLDTVPLRDAESVGPFRGHPKLPGNPLAKSPVSSAWVGANNATSGRGGIHAVIMLSNEGNKVIENMGREGQLWRQGVRRNDTILAVNDRFVKDLSLHEVHGLIEGNEGTRVFLTLQRAAESEEGTFSHLGGNFSKPWKVSVIRTHSYVIDCLIATHEELLVTMQNRSEDYVRMDYSSPLVTDMHDRVVNSMMVLKRDQQILLKDKAELQCRLDEYDRQWNINAVDGRVTDDENRRLVRELEERDKMMELMAADFDEEMGDARNRIAALSIKLNQPFESIHEMHGDQKFENRFASDIARVLNTDEERVAVVGMTRGSVIVDTVFLPPNATSRDQRPARQLVAALKAKADQGDDLLYHPSSTTARTVDMQALPEATILNRLRNSVARLSDDNAELMRERDEAVSENTELKRKVHALERAAAVAEQTIDELRTELAIIRNSLSKDQSIADRDAWIQDLQSKNSKLDEQLKDLGQQHKSQVASLQAVIKAEGQRNAETDAKARDLKTQLAEAERKVSTLQGQLAAATGIRESSEHKARKLNEHMEIMRETEKALRKEIMALQTSVGQLQRASNKSQPAASDDRNVAKLVADLEKLRKQLEDVVPTSKHKEMMAECSDKLAGMARKLAEYEKRVADVNDTLAKHARELVEGGDSKAAKHDNEREAVLQKKRADGLKDQLEYRKAEVAGLRQQLRDMLVKSNLTGNDVAVVLQENLKTITLQTKELETLRAEKVEYRASIESYRKEFKDCISDIRRLLRVELEKGDGGILHRLHHRPSNGAAQPLEPLIKDITNGRDPVDAIWIRGLEARGRQMQERIASLEKGVIVDWLAGSKQHDAGTRHSPFSTPQKDVYASSPSSEADRRSSVGQSMISEHSPLRRYQKTSALSSKAEGDDEPRGAPNQGTNQPAQYIGSRGGAPYVGAGGGAG